MSETRRPSLARKRAGTFALASLLAFAIAGQAAAQAPAATASAPVFPLTAVWTITLDTAPVGLPAYDGAHAYVVLKPDADRGHPKRRLIAVSLADGATQWTRETDDIDGLTAGDDMLFASAGASLQAYTAAGGEPQWRLDLGSPLAAPLHYQDGWLIAVTQGSDAVAMRARDGAKLWQVHLPSPATGEPALAGDALYVPLTDNRVQRLKLQNGAVEWDEKILSQPSVIVAFEDRVFVGTRQYWFYALKPRDGRVLWRARVGSSVVGTPSVDAAGVYFLALDNLLRALDRAGGSLIWRQILKRRERFGPTRADGVLFVSGASPTIQGYAVDGGKPAGSFDAPHDLGAPIRFVPGLTSADFLVVAMSGEGEMLALRPASLSPEPFAVSSYAYFTAGWPVWR